MPRKLPPNVYSDRDRHGNVRIYFRMKRGPKIRLREVPGTSAFNDEVAAARFGIVLRKQPAANTPPHLSAAPGSFDELINDYEKRGIPSISSELGQRRLRMLREIADHQLAAGKRNGDQPFALMQRRHVVHIRDELRQTQGARNNIVKCLSAMFAWAIEAGIATANPARGIRRSSSGDGFHAWSLEEIDRYIAAHPPGTMAHRALMLFLFSGLRLADAAIAGRQHLYQRRNETTGMDELWLRIRPGKTRRSSGVVIDIPVLPQLATALEGVAGLTFLTNAHGQPFTTDGLGNRMRKWCDAAGLPHCTAHGLRKAGATIAAENGADYELLKAIWGWTTAGQANHYVRSASRTRIAATAGKFLKLREQK